MPGLEGVLKTGQTWQGWDQNPTFLALRLESTRAWSARQPLGWDQVSGRFDINLSHLSGLGFHRDNPNIQLGKGEQGELGVLPPRNSLFKPRGFGDAGVEGAPLSLRVPMCFWGAFWGDGRDQIPFSPGAEGGPEHQAPAPDSFQFNKTTEPARFQLSGLWFIPGLRVTSKSYQFHTDFEGIIPSRLLFPWHGLPGAQGLTRAHGMG